MTGTGARYHRRGISEPKRRELTELSGLSYPQIRRTTRMPVAVTHGGASYHRIGGSGRTECCKQIFHTGLLGEVALWRAPCRLCFPPGAQIDPSL